MAGEKSRNEALAEAFAAAEQRKSMFFEPASRLQMVEKLEHLSRFSDFLLLVTGPQGAGKTLLMQQLQKVPSDRTLRVCSLDGGVSGDLNGMLKAISSQLSPEISLEGDNQHILNGLYEFAQVMAAQHMQWILLVDNAEQLEPAAQKLLLQMISDAQGLPQKPHLLLFGEESLQSRLDKHEEYQLLEGQLHHIQLTPFTETEASEYLRLRYSAAEALTDKQMKAIFETSGGYPGALNSSAEALFRSGSVTRSAGRRGMPKIHLAGVVSVLLAVLAVALWQYWPEATDSEGDRTLVQLDLPVNGDAVVAADTAQPTDEIQLNAPTSFTPDQTPASLPVKVVAGSEAEADQPVAQASESKAVEVVDAPVAVAPTASVAATVEQPAQTAPVQPVSEPVAAVVKSPQPTVTEKPASKPVVVATKPASESVSAAKPVSSATLSKTPLSDAEKALLSWPDGAYTLQVLGAGIEKSAADFIRAQQQPQKFYLFRTRYKNKPWFVVVYGQYKDRTTASAASKNLPAELAKLRPWARSIQGIQAELAVRK